MVYYYTRENGIEYPWLHCTRIMFYRSSCNGTVGLPPPAMISIQPSDQPVSKGFMDAGPLGLSAR